MLNVTKPDGKQVRKSAQVEAEIAQVTRAQADHQTEIETLAARYDADLLAGDALAEKNEIAAAAARRGVRRCELRLTELQTELGAATEAEAAASKAEAQRTATAAVEAVLAKIKAHYEEPARKIAAFLSELEQADHLAWKAGVATATDRTRATSDRVEPAHELDQPFYVDDHGNEVSSPYPPGTYTFDQDGRRYSGGQLVKPYRQRTRTIRVAEKRTRGERLPSLTSLVHLPGARIDDPPFRVSTKHGEG